MTRLFELARQFLYLFYDKGFSRNKTRYIFQCAIATFIVFLALKTLSLISSDLVVASIASTAFIVFTLPNGQRSRVRFILGGYIVGIALGCSYYYLMQYCTLQFPDLTPHAPEVFGALAVGSSIFCMVVFNTEHPPAAAAALAMIINDWNGYTLLVTIVAVASILLSRHILRRYLINLL